MLKNLKFVLCSGLLAVIPIACVAAENFDDFEIVEDIDFETPDVDVADEVSSNALNNYNVEGSLFEKITNLEQEKVVMQLEKEHAQLDLELERLNAEKIKLQMELDTLSGRAEQQQHELEAAKAQLELQTEKLKRQQEQLDEEDENEPVVKQQPKKEISSVSSKYKLINVIGIGNQLQATIEDVSTGQNKRIMVGKNLDGYTVKSISLNDGITFEKDGVSENLNIGK